MPAKNRHFCCVTFTFAPYVEKRRRRAGADRCGRWRFGSIKFQEQRPWNDFVAKLPTLTATPVFWHTTLENLNICRNSCIRHILSCVLCVLFISPPQPRLRNGHYFSRKHSISGVSQPLFWFCGIKYNGLCAVIFFRCGHAAADATAGAFCEWPANLTILIISELLLTFSFKILNLALAPQWASHSPAGTAV